MELRLLSNAELVRKAHIELDSLTSTPLEIEMIRRLEDLVDWEPVLDIVQQTYAHQADKALTDISEVLERVADLESVGGLAEIVKALEEHNVETIEVLREKLERADKFYDVAQEAGEAFSMLAKLAETSQ